MNLLFDLTEVILDKQRTPTWPQPIGNCRAKYSVYE